MHICEDLLITLTVHLAALHGGTQCSFCLAQQEGVIGVACCHSVCNGVITFQHKGLLEALGCDGEGW